jgi:hypothetical protein
VIGQYDRGMTAIIIVITANFKFSEREKAEYADANFRGLTESSLPFRGAETSQ